MKQQQELWLLAICKFVAKLLGKSTVHPLMCTSCMLFLFKTTKQYDTITRKPTAAACCVRIYGATTTASLVNLWYILSWHIQHNNIDSTPANQMII
jgi:hypothetical protein